MKKIALLAVTLVLLSSIAVPTFSAAQYTITELGMGDQYTCAYGLNNLGQAVGDIGASSTSHGFFWDKGVMTDIGPFPTWGSSYSTARGVNDSGLVVGQYQNPQLQYAACTWKSGTITPLSLPSGVSGSSANGINGAGQIVGSCAYTGAQGGHAMLWGTNGAWQDLGTLGGSYSTARDINENGWIVGDSYTTGTTNTHGFVRKNGTLVDLETLGGATSNACAVNDGGQVVGYSRLANNYVHAFIWQNDVMTDLGSPSGWSYAYDINNSGSVVGTYGSSQTACIWKNGSAVDLNALIPSGTSWSLNVAYAINDTGQIVGIGRLGGQQRAFLLTPVPEPSALLTLLCGAGGALGCAFRRRR